MTWHPQRTLVLLTLFLTVVASVACANSTAPPETSAGESPPPTVSHGLPADVIAMVLPATGAESRWTQGLDAFGRLIRLAAARECGQAEGGAGHPPPAFIRLSALPDLEFVRRHGLTISATPAMPDQVARPHRPAGHECRQAADTVVKDFKALYGGLQSQWWRALDELRGHPQVSGVLAGLGGCLDRHGIAAASEKEFFAVADSRLMALDDDLGEDLDDKAVARLDRELGAAYATCMQPVEAVREPLRAALRVEFVTARQTGVEQLRRELPARIRELEQRYGLRFSYPVP